MSYAGSVDVLTRTSLHIVRERGLAYGFFDNTKS